MNVFEFIEQHGDDEVFIDRPSTQATSAPCGSREKIFAMRQRLERGESIWNPLDAADVKPVELSERTQTRRLRP